MVGGTVLFSDPVPSQADAPAAAGTPEALVAACNGWSGPAPRGAVAKRVVATVAVDGEFVPRTLSGWWVKAALDEALFGKDHPRILTVHGFCPAPKCKTLSVEHTTEQRVSIGVVYVRTVTTTKQRCKGKVSTSVTYSVWRNR